MRAAATLEDTVHLELANRLLEQAEIALRRRRRCLDFGRSTRGRRGRRGWNGRYGARRTKWILSRVEGRRRLAAILVQRANAVAHLLEPLREGIRARQRRLGR